MNTFSLDHTPARPHTLGEVSLLAALVGLLGFGACSAVPPRPTPPPIHVAAADPAEASEPEPEPDPAPQPRPVQLGGRPARDRDRPAAPQGGGCYTDPHGRQVCPAPIGGFFRRGG